MIRMQRRRFGISQLNAEDNVTRRYDFVLEREVNQPDIGDLKLAITIPNAIRDGYVSLGRSPFTCSNADQSPFLREWIIPFGRSGVVVLFEIVDSPLVVNTA